MKVAKFLKSFLLFSVVLSMVVFPNGWANAHEQNIISSSQIDRGNNFRQQYGFEPVSKTSVQEYASDSINKYGVYLTNEEMGTLDERARVIEDFKAYNEKLMTDFVKDYGGHYFEHKINNGVFRVALVDKGRNTSEIRRYLESYPNKEKIVFYNVKYSYNELVEAQQTVNKILIEGKWYTATTEISIAENKIIVSIKDPTKNQIEQLTNSVNEDQLKIVSGNGINTLSRYSYARPVYAGLALSFPNWTCTAGYSASGSYDPNSPVPLLYLISAGHCGSVGDTVSQGGQPIGQVVKKQTDGNVDALAILVPYPLSPQIYGTTSVMDVLYDSFHIIGNTYCKSGVVTDITCGPLVSITISGFVYDDTTSSWNFLTNLGGFTAQADGGDSGAIVYAPQLFVGNGVAGILSGSRFSGQHMQVLFSTYQNIRIALDAPGTVIGP